MIKEKMNIDGWYYREGDTPVGPFDLKGLERLFEVGMIDESTLVQHGQSRHWTEYGALDDAIKSTENGSEQQEETSRPVFAESEITAVDELSLGIQDNNQENEHHEYSNLSQSLNDWLLKPVTPWRRYGARILDLSLNGVLGWFIIGVAFYMLAPVSAERFFSTLNPLLDLMLTVFVGGIITGIMIGFSGSSIGKWVFGIRVTDTNGRPIGVILGVIRDLSVWVKGLGFGLPVVTLVTMYLGYSRLKEKGATAWDESGGYIVTHRPSGAFQYVLNTIGILLILFINAFVRTLEQI